MNDRTFQVRRFYAGGNGNGIQVATGITLAEAAEVAFRMAQLQEVEGSNFECSILAD